MIIFGLLIIQTGVSRAQALGALPAASVRLIAIGQMVISAGLILTVLFDVAKEVLANRDAASSTTDADG